MVVTRQEKKLYFDAPFVVSADSLTRLQRAILNASPSIEVRLGASLSDGTEAKFERLEDLIEFPNSSSWAITEIALRLYEGKERIGYISFGRESSGYKARVFMQIANGENKYDSLIKEIEAQIQSFQKTNLFWFFDRFSTFGADGNSNIISQVIDFFKVTLIWGIIWAFSFAVVFVLFGYATYFPFLDEALLLGILFSLMPLVLALSAMGIRAFYTALYPEAVFRIGDGERRYQGILKFQSGIRSVVGGLILATLCAIMALASGILQ